ncbi:BT1926 family outer membrane beta-barrel protein, partial [Bacteroides fragilis]
MNLNQSVAELRNNSADENMGEIPNYRAVADAQSFAYNVSAGVDRYFN